MPATARDIQENSANVSSDVTDEEEMNEDDIHNNMSLEVNIKPKTKTLAIRQKHCCCLQEI